MRREFVEAVRQGQRAIERVIPRSRPYRAPSGGGPGETIDLRDVGVVLSGFLILDVSYEAVVEEGELWGWGSFLWGQDRWVDPLKPEYGDMTWGQTAWGERFWPEDRPNRKPIAFKGPGYEMFHNGGKTQIQLGVVTAWDTIQVSNSGALPAPADSAMPATVVASGTPANTYPSDEVIESSLAFSAAQGNGLWRRIGVAKSGVLIASDLLSVPIAKSNFALKAVQRVTITWLPPG